jgi:hypothetical protein
VGQGALVVCRQAWIRNLDGTTTLAIVFSHFFGRIVSDTMKNKKTAASILYSSGSFRSSNIAPNVNRRIGNRRAMTMFAKPRVVHSNVL